MNRDTAQRTKKLTRKRPPWMDQTPAVMAGRSYHNSIAPGLGFVRNPKFHTPLATQEIGKNGSPPATGSDWKNGGEGVPQERGRNSTRISIKETSLRDETKNSRRKLPPGSEKPQAREGKENPGEAFS